jgi:hypothetical protein
MSLSQRESEPPTPANESREGMEQGLVYPSGRHWSKAALSKYNHKSCNEQAVRSDAAEGDKRGKSFRIADRSAA